MKGTVDLAENIPENIKKQIWQQAADNEHFEEVYRVAKWGIIEEKAFISTFDEILQGYIPDDDQKYPKDEIGTYSTSVYTERKSCDKFMHLLKRSVRLRKVYPFPVVLKGKTSSGAVQRTIDRIPEYPDETHVDWWIFEGKCSCVLDDFDIEQEG